MRSARSASLPPRPDAAEAVQARMEELRALLPELPPWTGDEGLGETCAALLDLLERKQRHLIQEDIRLASLRELTETLLHEPDEERVLRTISVYLGHAYGLVEVMVLAKTDEGGLRGYRARARSGGTCEEIRWPRERLRGSVWEVALEGGAVHETDPRNQPAGAPPPLPQILPLLAGSRISGRERTPAGEGSPEVIGLLALRGDETLGAGTDPLEVGQIAFQAATLLESVRSHRRALQEMRFRECLLEAMGDGLLATDREGRWTAVNRAALGLLGEDRGGVLGRSFGELSRKAPQLVAACRASLDRRRPTGPLEGRIQGPEGPIPINLSVVPLDEGPGMSGGVVATLSDLRPVRAMEEELRRLDRLAALGRFATAVAHEIRNPLAAIGAGIEYLGRAVASDRQDDIRRLRSEVARLDRIVCDLLQPARNRPLERSPVDVGAFVGRACEAARPLAEQKGVVLHTREPAGPGDAPVRLEVDVDRMLQVVVNLLRNAIEAAPPGSEVEIGWEGSDPEPPAGVRFWVQDEGCGIPPEERARIFEPFYSTKADGTGLGLYVSDSIVKQHGGELHAETPAGGGTRMVISLPATSR